MKKKKIVGTPLCIYPLYNQNGTTSKNNDWMHQTTPKSDRVKVISFWILVIKIIFYGWCFCDILFMLLLNFGKSVKMMKCECHQKLFDVQLPWLLCNIYFLMCMNLDSIWKVFEIESVSNIGSDWLGTIWSELIDERGGKFQQFSICAHLLCTFFYDAINITSKWYHLSVCFANNIQKQFCHICKFWWDILFDEMLSGFIL